jgi:hypothetical protein
MMWEMKRRKSKLNLKLRSKEYQVVKRGREVFTSGRPWYSKTCHENKG